MMIINVSHKNPLWQLAAELIENKCDQADN